MEDALNTGNHKSRFRMALHQMLGKQPVERKPTTSRPMEGPAPQKASGANMGRLRAALMNSGSKF